MISTSYSEDVAVSNVLLPLVLGGKATTKGGEEG